MSRDWIKEELHTASEAMKQNGYMGFEEFCHALEQKRPVRFNFQERSHRELEKGISEISFSLKFLPCMDLEKIYPSSASFVAA